MSEAETKVLRDLVEACLEIEDEFGPTKNPEGFAALYWARAVLDPEAYEKDHPAVAEGLERIREGR